MKSQRRRCHVDQHSGVNDSSRVIKDKDNETLCDRSFQQQKPYSAVDEKIHHVALHDRAVLHPLLRLCKAKTPGLQSSASTAPLKRKQTPRFANLPENLENCFLSLLSGIALKRVQYYYAYVFWFTSVNQNASEQQNPTGLPEDWVEWFVYRLHQEPWALGGVVVMGVFVLGTLCLVVFALLYGCCCGKAGENQKKKKKKQKKSKQDGVI
ncbi:hypothetical protein F2P81_021973 [Scophthalmus maximus]|uniref:Uncharacterized protein n=1 Tax=Scophthalmus maximus TaxID=52904 RepID=A0A6A4S0X4_SCOMX|nr:hypothetical protein F2P81_021973 [Scophthalmus maximus]